MIDGFQVRNRQKIKITELFPDTWIVKDENQVGNIYRAEIKIWKPPEGIRRIRIK